MKFDFIDKYHAFAGCAISYPAFAGQELWGLGKIGDTGRPCGDQHPSFHADAQKRLLVERQLEEAMGVAE
jgi:hypothetical protein